MITQNFNIYLHAGIGVAPVVHASQYSQGETWTFTILDNDGSVYRPSSGALIGLKSDGRVIAGITGTVNADGSVSIVTTQQLTAAAGRGVFELTIDGGTNGTANFIVEVEKKPTDGGVLSESDLSIIQQGINSVTPQVIQETVSDYLAEHMTNPPIDPTLTVSNAAADAKVTGDKIADLKNAIDDIANDTIPLLFERGEYVTFTGAFVASPAWSRTGYIRVDKYIDIDITTTKASAYNCFYDANHEFIMHFQIQSGTTNRPVPENAVYMALSNETADMLNTVVSPHTIKKDEEIQQEITNIGASKVSKLTAQDQNYLFELFLTGVDTSKTLVIGQIANKYPLSNGYYSGIYISYADDPYNWIAGWTIDYEAKMPSVVKLLEQGNSGVSGYALIDYTPLTEGTRIYPMIPINNDSVTDMGNSPAISAYVNGYKSDDINVLNADMDMAVIQSSKTRANLFPSANSVLEFVHFSDVHGAEKAWKRVVSYINTHTNYLQFAIMTGDYVVSAQDSTVDLYGQVTPFNRPILNVVGNHDIQVDDGGSTADKAETYRRLFADASNWGATFGTGENIMYYYKDFTSSKIRLVVIDQYYWDATEASWLESVLNDARASGYHVITASHTQSGAFTRMLETPFNTIDDYEPYTHWGDTVEPFEPYIKAFKDAGGKHIVHLCGHWHHDMTGITTNGILNMVIESASPFAVPWLNALRIDGTKSYDCFNVIAVDTNVNVLKAVRIGNAYDGYLQHKTVMCIDYDTQIIKRFVP